MLGRLCQELVGELLDGRYQLTRYIGEGAFAWVYEASEVLRGEHVARVAVKLIDPQDDGHTQGLMREIQALAQFSHPSILVYRTSGEVASGRLQGMFYIVTELAERSLGEMLRNGQRPTGSELNAIAAQISSALAYIHSRGGVHRDVKPDNILRVGGSWQLADFGMARAVSGSLVSASGRKGTLGYMAPEMLDGQVGPASDVYSLGVTLLEGLTGRLAHDGSTEGEFIRNLSRMPANIPGDIREPWRTVLSRLLERDAKGRCSADELSVLLLARPEDQRDSKHPGARGTAPVVRPAHAPISPARVAVASSRPWEREGFRVGEEIEGPDGGVDVWVLPGEFTMGGDPKFHDAETRHRVCITRGFWLAKHELTNAQYRLSCRATRRRFPKHSNQGDGHPLVHVSWEDANAYCDHYGLSLPTEAQWEYAARGPELGQYPWGGDWDARKCCSAENRGPGGRTFPVGSFPEALGCACRITSAWCNRSQRVPLFWATASGRTDDDWCAAAWSASSGAIAGWCAGCKAGRSRSKSCAQSSRAGWATPAMQTQRHLCGISLGDSSQENRFGPLGAARRGHGNTQRLQRPRTKVRPKDQNDFGLPGADKGPEPVVVVPDDRIEPVAEGRPAVVGKVDPRPATQHAVLARRGACGIRRR